MAADTRVAVTLGDPRGIGPEVAFEALRAGAALGCSVVLLGPENLSGKAPPECAYQAVDEPGGSRFFSSAPEGSPTSAGRAGRLALAAIEQAAAMAMAGEVDAVVTGPVHKPSLRAAGLELPGHTELLARLAGASEVGMLMAAESAGERAGGSRRGSVLRVLLATTHHPLACVPQLVTEELLVSQCTLLARELRSGWRISEPRIALCALNPHASDGGLFGDEEARTFIPAIGRLRRTGIDVSGPESADTVFARALEGEFDAVVAPYHDVGMAAFKTVAFGRGVNVTLGLPFVRTSPDHGTAFDIAGAGKADPASMAEALALAAKLARGRGRADG